MKILFILKDRFYNNSHAKSYGLMNSAFQVAEYLETLGHTCKLVTVIDSNFIDKEVYQFKPDIVIIEALWVPGEKMKELLSIKRYKHIKWIVRIHSDIGFLSAETLASKYVSDYINLKNKNLIVALNNEKFNTYYSKAMRHKFTYLPNIISIKNNDKFERNKLDNKIINIGCFGSLRILKNHAFQALCAIDFAEKLGKKLYFHITTDISEEAQLKNPVLQNLKSIFENNKHELVIHDWMNHQDFEHLIHHMDIGMQISFTESFNIVAADFVNSGVPVIVSEAISWMPKIFRTSTINYKKVVNKMCFINRYRDFWFIKKTPMRHLLKYNKKAKTVWYDFMKKVN